MNCTPDLPEMFHVLKMDHRETRDGSRDSGVRRMKLHDGWYCGHICELERGQRTAVSPEPSFSFWVSKWWEHYGSPAAAGLRCLSQTNVWHALETDMDWTLIETADSYKAQPLPATGPFSSSD